MAWNTRNKISLIDVNAEPHIQEIIQIPDEPDAEDQMSYEITSASIPFLDVEPYTQMYAKNPSERRLGSGNFFKGKLAFANSDKKSRLRRIHQALKRIWYMNVERDSCIENQVTLKNELRYLSIYKELFTVDFVSDPSRF